MRSFESAGEPKRNNNQKQKAVKRYLSCVNVLSKRRRAVNSCSRRALLKLSDGSSIDTRAVAEAQTKKITASNSICP